MVSCSGKCQGKKVFCRQCIGYWLTFHPTCPNCREIFRGVEVPPIALNMLKQAKFYCDLRSHGCDKVFTYEYRMKHYREDCVAELGRVCQEQYKNVSVKDTSIWAVRETVIREADNALRTIGISGL